MRHRLRAAWSALPGLLRDPLLLVLRLLWGAHLLAVGLEQAGALHGVRQVLEGAGVPLPAVAAAAWVGVVLAGGASWVLGLAARGTALAVAIASIAWLAAVDRDVLAASSPVDLRPLLEAEQLGVAVAAMVILTFGPGRASLDHLLGRTGEHR